MGRNSLVGADSPRDFKEAYLKERGWFEWYNKDYWCHPNKRPYSFCDCTNWGVSFTEAFRIEYNGLDKNSW